MCCRVLQNVAQWCCRAAVSPFRCVAVCCSVLCSCPIHEAQYYQLSLPVSRSEIHAIQVPLQSTSHGLRDTHTHTHTHTRTRTHTHTNVSTSNFQNTTRKVLQSKGGTCTFPLFVSLALALALALVFACARALALALALAERERGRVCTYRGSCFCLCLCSCSCSRFSSRAPSF